VVAEDLTALLLCDGTVIVSLGLIGDALTSKIFEIGVVSSGCGGYAGCQ
jgi:hypothetical protein